MTHTGGQEPVEDSAVGGVEPVGLGARAVESLGPVAGPRLEFFYEAQRVDGLTIRGSIEAADGGEAQWNLAAMGLRVIDLRPADAPGGEALRGGASDRSARRGGVLRGGDFAAFNQQLADIAAAGLPLERGLRLMAREMPRRLAGPVNTLADDLESGMPLEEAFERHGAHFPPLYAKVLKAGVSSGQLPGMLLALGRHVQTTHELRQALWRAASYPMMALAATVGVMMFLASSVVPVIREVAADGLLRDSKGPSLPLVSRLVFGVVDMVPLLLAGALVGGLGLVVWWRRERRAGRTPALLDRWVRPMILIGPVMRSAWCGQWCEGVRLGVEAGRPLAEAMQLAADATGSITTMHDARMLAAAHERGESMSSVTGLKVLSPAICLAIDLAISRNDLAPALACLRDMHHQQTRHRIAQMQTALRPVLIILVGVIIALVIAGLLVPFNVLVDSAGTVTL